MVFTGWQGTQVPAGCPPSRTGLSAASWVWPGSSLGWGALPRAVGFAGRTVGGGLLAGPSEKQVGICSQDVGPGAWGPTLMPASSP